MYEGTHEFHRLFTYNLLMILQTLYLKRDRSEEIYTIRLSTRYRTVERTFVIVAPSESVECLEVLCYPALLLVFEPDP